MSDHTIRVALYVLGTIGALAVICIGVLIAVLPTPDVAALAVLSSIASAAVGGVAGTITTSKQGAAEGGDSAKKAPPKGAEREPVPGR